VKQSEAGIELRVAALQRQAVDTIAKMELEGSVAGIAAIRAG